MAFAASNFFYKFYFCYHLVLCIFNFSWDFFVSYVIQKYIDKCLNIWKFSIMLLISSLIQLSAVNILYITCRLSNLFRYGLKHRMWFGLLHVPWAFEKNVWSAVVDEVFYVS
jgi:hypothetical protein